MFHLAGKRVLTASTMKWGCDRWLKLYRTIRLKYEPLNCHDETGGYLRVDQCIERQLESAKADTIHYRWCAPIWGSTKKVITLPQNSLKPLFILRLSKFFEVLHQHLKRRDETWGSFKLGTLPKPSLWLWWVTYFWLALKHGSVVWQTLWVYNDAASESKYDV